MDNLIHNRVYRAALYVRLSKEDGDSIVNQKDLIRSFLADKPDIRICAECVDDGYSGANFDRPAVQEMLSMAGNQICCIPFLGIRFIAVNEDYDSQNSPGSSVSLDVSLKAMVYEMYSRLWAGACG